MSSLAFIDRRATARSAIFLVQMMLLDVVNNRYRNQIAHAHLTPKEKADFRAADIVLNELLDDVDVVLPWLQGCEGLVDIGSAAFDDERL